MAKRSKIAYESSMPPLLQFIIRRILLIPVSLLIITLVLYAGVMLTPPEARAELYFPPRLNPNLTDAQLAQLQKTIIDKYHLRDSYPVQYAAWIKSIFTGSWGYSPSLNEDVLPALLQRTPATLELTLYSLLIFIPLGLISGAWAGWNPNKNGDNFFRVLAFFGTSMPPFILALILLAIFYIQLGWFAPGRLADSLSYQISKGTIPSLTGFLTIDSLLDGRLDVFVDAVRHLVLPVLTLSLYNWATLGRITRATIIEQRRKEFIVSARARGLNESKVMWHHAFRNTLPPSLTSIGFSAASILTGAFVVEIIYNLHGVSEVLAASVSNAPDAPAALGFTVYSVFMVLVLMFLVDVAQALLDPRVRDEILNT